MEAIKVMKFASFVSYLKSSKADFDYNHHPISNEIQAHHWGAVLIKPKPSESLLSWLLHQSNQFNEEYTLKDFLEYEQEYWNIQENVEIFEGKSRSMFRSLGSLDILSLPLLNSSLRKRGLTTDISNLQLQIPSWLNPIDDKYCKDRFLIRKDLVYCAVCWKDAETRYFRREWRFALVVMCSEHAVLLRKDCPNCGKYLFSDSRTGIITTIKYKWLGACVNCEYSFGCKSKQSNNQTNIDHELLDMQLKVINNVRKNEFANLIQDLTLLFGIAWKENELISKYVDLVLKWVNIKYRSIGGNLIIFDIWKFELLKKYDLSKVNLKLRADGIYDLDTCEIKCFVASCNRKYFLNKPNGKSNLTLQLRTHGGLKRIVRDIYKCKRCNIGFGNQYNYQSHYYEIHTTTVDCNKCKEKFPTLSKYQIHLFDKHKKIWNCGRCNLSFDSVSGYHSHYGKEHQKTWNCMKCTINFTSRSKYSSHYQKRHRIKKT